MRFHILGVPHTVSSKSHLACAFTQKVVKFGRMMTERGHTVIHYGHEDSDLVCTEHVTVVTEADWKIAYGDHDWRKHFFKYAQNDHCYQTFFKNAIVEINKRKQKNDFVLPFWGSGVRAVCDALSEVIVCEPGIGYGGGIWTNCKVFESYAVAHAYNGLSSVDQCKQGNYDYIIPNYFEQDDFLYSAEKDDYFLFLGRIYRGKGVHIAIEAVEAVGGRLVIAGQNGEEFVKEMGYEKVPDFIELVGYADVEKRKQLLSRAKAALIPSQYVEPFAGVQVECMFSGTPTITTDWGVFNENNWHGVTGYRCRTFEQYLWALKNIQRIRPQDCREYAIRNFTLHRVAEQYEDFFAAVLDIHEGDGWYQLKERENLNVFSRYYPRLSKTPNYAKIHAADQPFAQQLAVEIQQLQPELVIDVGCEAGTFTEAINALGIHCIGVDSDADMLQIAHDQHNFHQQDVLSLTGSLAGDVVLALDLGSIVDPQHEMLLFACLWQTLKPGGRLLWTSAAPGVRGDSYFNWRTLADWQERLESIGFVYDPALSGRLATNLPQAPDWFKKGLLCFNKPQC